ncbi:hypothetical protein [Rhizobium phage RHEph12]|nr:hypothetical protein [Rhizobium phage RHEph12]
MKKEYVSPYIQAGIKAYIDWFSMEWKKYVPEKGRELIGVLLPNITDMRKEQDTKQKITNPRLKVALARIEQNGERGAAAKRYHATNTMIDRTAGRAIVRRLVPCRVGFVTNFVTDRADEVEKFAQMMLNNYPGPTFFFEDDVGFRVECRCYLDQGVDFPQADSSGPGDLYTVEPVVSLTTYIGTVEETGLIRKINVRLNEAIGSILTTVHFDVDNGLVQALEPETLTYTGPFDSTSSQWKGI